MDFNEWENTKKERTSYTWVGLEMNSTRERCILVPAIIIVIQDGI